MTTKVDRLAPRAPTARTEGTAPAAQTASTTAPAATPATAGPVGSFDPNAPPAPLTPRGGHYSGSARIDALWGGEPEGVRGGRSPEEIAKARAERRELQGKIADRVDHLDGKWRYTRNTTKLSELEGFLHDSKNVDAGLRANLQPKLDAAHAAEAKLAEVKQRADALGRGGTPEERTALAKELSAAKRQVSTTVGAVTQAVDDAGLKVERLAHAERDIDPRGAKEGGSLLDMVGRFLHLTFFITGSSYKLDAHEEQVMSEIKHTAEAALRDEMTRTRVVLQELQHEIARASPATLPIRG